MENYRSSSNTSGNYTTIAYNNNMMIRRRAEQRVTWSIQEDIDLLTTILTNKQHIAPAIKDNEKTRPTEKKQTFSTTPVAPIPVSRSSSFSTKILSLPGAENETHSSVTELAAHQVPSPKSSCSLSLADQSLITSPTPLSNSDVTLLPSAESATTSLGKAATSGLISASNQNMKTTKPKKKNMFWNIVSEGLKKYSTIHHHTRNKRQCKDRFALLYWKKYYSVSTFFNESKNKNLDAELQKCLMMDVDDFLCVLEAKFDLDIRGDLKPQSTDLAGCNNGYDERSNVIENTKPPMGASANEIEHERQSSTASIVKSENEFESDGEHKNSFYKKKNSTGGKNNRVSKGHHILNILLMYIYLHFEFNGSSALKIKSEPGLEQKKIWNSSFENANELEVFDKTKSNLNNDQEVGTSHINNESNTDNEEPTNNQQLKEYIKKLENDVAILNNIVSKQTTHIKTLKTELNSYKSSSSLAPSMTSSVSSSDRSASNNNLWGNNFYYYHPYNTAPNGNDSSMSNQSQQQQRPLMPQLANQQQQQQRPLVPAYAPQYTNFHYKNSMPELRHQSRASSLANIVVQASHSAPHLSNPLPAVQHNQSISHSFNNNNGVHNRNGSLSGMLSGQLPVPVSLSGPSAQPHPPSSSAPRNFEANIHDGGLQQNNPPNIPVSSSSNNNNNNNNNNGSGYPLGSTTVFSTGYPPNIHPGNANPYMSVAGTATQPMQPPMGVALVSTAGPSVAPQDSTSNTHVENQNNGGVGNTGAQSFNNANDGTTGIATGFNQF